eukprot:543930-Pelagomonas_calceolata.AAC.1
MDAHGRCAWKACTWKASRWRACTSLDRHRAWIAEVMRMGGHNACTWVGTRHAHGRCAWKMMHMGGHKACTWKMRVEDDAHG